MFQIEPHHDQVRVGDVVRPHTGTQTTRPFCAQQSSSNAPRRNAGARHLSPRSARWAAVGAAAGARHLHRSKECEPILERRT